MKKKRLPQKNPNNDNHNPNTDVNNTNVNNTFNVNSEIINNRNVNNQHYREYYDKNDDLDGRQSIPVLHDNDSDNEISPNVIININNAEDRNNNHNNNDANGYPQ